MVKVPGRSMGDHEFWKWTGGLMVKALTQIMGDFGFESPLVHIFFTMVTVAISVSIAICQLPIHQFRKRVYCTEHNELCLCSNNVVYVISLYKAMVTMVQ